MEKSLDQRIRIILIDDHPVVCEGLTTIINKMSDLEVCGCASGHNEALFLLERTNPHVALLDISLQDCDGMDLLRVIKSGFPNVAVVVLSVHDEQVYAARAIRAGASGYIMKKDADSAHIIATVREVARGNFGFSPSVQRRLFWGQSVPGEIKDHLHSLTDRELAVFRLLGRGATTEQIAGILRISPKTVETHRMHIKTKLRVDSLNKLVEHAVSWQRRQL
ncbi:MAG TPA: response regulator transcription factor [Kiritimatiellia bacterium]|nr:response regulator transcription factor [Kiritimatiellia bacterium]HSA19750.1 response regulator transcription factor [Kiritimatiellia bacterium]